MGYVVVVTIPHSEADFPDIYHVEEYSGDHYRTKEEALPELEEAKKDPKYPEAWIEFRCDDDCEHCNYYQLSGDICTLYVDFENKTKGGANNVEI